MLQRMKPIVGEQCSVGMMKNAKNSAIIVRFVDLHGGIGSGLVWLMLQRYILRMLLV